MAVFALLAGCSAALKPATAAELQAVASTERGPITAAQTELDSAKDTLSELKAQVGAAERDVEIAEYRIRRESADVEVARLRFEAAQETRDADAMLPSRAERERTAKALEIANATLALEEAELDHLEARIDYRSAVVAVKEAELALAQVVAVQGDDASAKAVERRAAFDTEVADAKATMAAEKQTVARYRSLLEEAESAHDTVAGEADPIDGSKEPGDDATSEPEPELQPSEGSGS
ncbi:MAG: hypothetical protein AAF654_05210 [Myxococcota bacterium]